MDLKATNGSVKFDIPFTQNTGFGRESKSKNMLQIRPMTSDDWSSAKRIFQEGIDTGLASLETEVGSYDDYM